MYCPYNDEYMADVVCTLTAAEGKLGLLHYAGTLLQPLDEIWLHMTSFHKNEHEEYLFSNSAFTVDLCRMATHGRELNVFTLMPGLYEKIEHMIQHCPYQPGRYEVPEYVQERVQHSDLTLPMMADGDYKFVFRLTTANNQTLVELNVEFDFE
jgi:hypothetical protein